MMVRDGQDSNSRDQHVSHPLQGASQCQGKASWQGWGRRVSTTKYRAVNKSEITLVGRRRVFKIWRLMRAERTFFNYNLDNFTKIVLKERRKFGTT